MVRLGLRSVGALLGVGFLLLGPARWAGAQSIYSLPDITVPADAGRDGAVVTFAVPPSTDGGTVACTWAPGSFFPVGRTFVRCQSTSGSASPRIGIFSVVVVADREPPSLSAPRTVVATAGPGLGSARVAYAPPVATDDGRRVPVSCSPASGSLFRVGTSVVTCSATDRDGNTARVSFRVVVRSAPAPAPPPTAQTQPPATAPAMTQPGLPASVPTTIAQGLCFPCTTSTPFTTTSTTVTPTTEAASAQSTTAPIAVSPVLANQDGTESGAPESKLPTGPKRAGGPSPALAAVGSLMVLAAVMVISLVARWRFDREPA